MLNNLLLSTLLTNITYLGYHKRFSNSRMFLDLQGCRKDIDLHNLNTTVFTFQKSLKILSTLWAKFGCVWFVTPKNNFVFKYFYKNPWAEFIEDYMYFWIKRWKPGFLTNYSGFASMTMRLQYPSALFYTNHTHNKDKFIEAFDRGLITLGLADSNSTRAGYNFLINANEKTCRSY